MRLAYQGIIAALIVGLLVDQSHSAEPQDRFSRDVYPLLAKYCLECHGTTVAEAEIDLTSYEKDAASELKRHPELWQRIEEVVKTDQMPPKDAPQPSDSENQQLISWIDEFLAQEAEKTSGDPGPVVLRRLSNAQYTYTLRDLTGVTTLDPAREFPVDGAAGEGFTNTGNALVMSPALVTKYLDAAKEVAKHAVLLPDGIEFSPSTTPADWTNEKLHAIRSFYQRFTSDDQQGASVNLQGIVFDTNKGGRLPIRLYLKVLFANANQISSTPNSIIDIAKANHLSPKYLTLLSTAISASKDDIFLQPLHEAWQRSIAGQPLNDQELGQLVQYVEHWQAALFRFTTVGHIGKKGGPTRWLEPVDPLASQLSIRQPLPPANDQGKIELSLLTNTAGDDGANDFARWQNPRFAAPGRQPLLLRDLPRIVSLLTQRKENALKNVMVYLAAVEAAQKLQSQAVAENAEESSKNSSTSNDQKDNNDPNSEKPNADKTEATEQPSNQDKSSPETDQTETTENSTKQELRSIDPAALAKEYQVDPDILTAWLNYLGVSVAGPIKIENHLKEQIKNSSGYDFINGWGSSQTPLILANSSDQHVRIPGNADPHSIFVHPSPSLEIVAGWQCPIATPIKISLSGQITHAHPECGNGVTWRIELRRKNRRQTLAQGIAHGGTPVNIESIEQVIVQQGDVVAFLVGPRDKNHSCDLTKINLAIKNVADDKQQWDLAGDASPDILSGNPHADRLGNPAVWHFFTEAIENAKSAGPTLPAGSLLAQWEATEPGDARKLIAEKIRDLVLGQPPADKASPDGILYQQLTSLQGPLLGTPLLAESQDLPNWLANAVNTASNKDLIIEKINTSGISESLIFGTEENPKDAHLVTQAPASTFVSIPADLLQGYEFQTEVVLDPKSQGEASLQAQVVAGRVHPQASLQAGVANSNGTKGTWTDGLQPASVSNPILVANESQARTKLLDRLTTFRELFPPALCYLKIVPVDEVVTLTLFYREDDHLQRLLLDEQQTAELNRLWDQLHFVSRDATKLVDAFAQLMEYATQDADPSVFEPLRGPIMQRAKDFEAQLVAAQPSHIAAIIEFAGKAFRRPMREDERQQLQEFYRQLRREEIPHEEAISLVLARVLVAPAFLYRFEQPPTGDQPGAVSDYELANRLSYFLWSSMPDRELLDVAASQKLTQGDTLVRQAQRMLQDPRAERLSREFAAYWLHIQNFDEFDEKSDQYFPTFAPLRAPMYEESLRFFNHLFQSDASILEILSADYTFVNGPLAEHYGVPGVTGDQWQKVQLGGDSQRSGILGQATVLATLAGASRTSPILRGNWVSEVLLGEKLPKPPKGVPPLPDDVAGRGGLTMRELVELHSNDEKCAVCHRRIDPMGFAMENFDAIGRLRSTDEAGKPIALAVKTIDGAEFSGPLGLRDYLLNQRRDAFVTQFCKKLAGFALGRSIQLSDRSLIQEMKSSLEKNEYRFSAALKPLLNSKQFREIRGRDFLAEGAQ
jgi:hypothetical protein